MLGGRDRNGSCLFAWAARPLAIPLPLIGATGNEKMFKEINLIFGMFMDS